MKLLMIKSPQMGHLTCFVGGLYILSLQTGAFQTNSSDKHELDFAQGIGKSCRESYIRTPTGLSPEGFHFERVDVEARSLRDNEKYFILRPEAIEAWFYLWRHTYDQMYRGWAWDAVIALEKYCRVEIRDVYSVSVSHDDVQQSFSIAGSLKYLLLIFFGRYCHSLGYLRL